MIDPVIIASLVLELLIVATSKLGEKYTESAISKRNELRDRIWTKLKEQLNVEIPLLVNENSSKFELEKLELDIQRCMENDAPFALEVTSLVQGINLEKLRDNSSIVQSNYGNARGYQTKVEGGAAYIGETHVHNLKSWESQRISIDDAIKIPNNVPRSGVAKFIGREPELEQLHTQLQQGSLISISAVEGMAGVGKTELAIQYTQKHASCYKGGICWLFAREFNIGTQIVGFAQSQLNLKIPEGLELVDEVAFCWRNWRTGDVLLIMDDVVNYSRDVEPYLPPVASTRVRVVMTTRQKFGQPIQSLPLGVLSSEPSLELLTVLIGEERVQSELEIAKTLCNWLEHLPLGVELVGRYLLQRTDLSLSTLLFRLQQKATQRQAFAHNALKPDEEINTATGKRGVEEAFNLSWEELNSSSQHLGKLLSLFAAAPIPWHLVESVERKYWEDDDLVFNVEEMNEARDKLIELHLLQLSEQQGQNYRLHSLIREFFRSKLEGEENNSDWEVNLKSAFCKAFIQEIPQISGVLTKELASHISPFIPHLEEIATTAFNYLNDDDFILPFISLGKFYEGQALYSTSTLWYQRCLDTAQTRFGNLHTSVAISLGNLAYIYWIQGQYTAAESLYVQALQINTQLLGEENLVVANNLNDLAYLYESQGRYTKAEPLYLEALELNRRLIGDSDPGIAVSLNNLAGLYATQGLYERAEVLYLESLVLNKQSLGFNHPIVASTLNYLANIYHNQGRYHDAEVFFLESLHIREKELGAEHPDTATSLNNLAALYKVQCRYTKAEQLYLRSFKIRERQLGAEHPDTATSLNNLATLYESMGRYEEAEPLYLRSLEIYQQTFGNNHPDTATSLNNLAAIYESMRRYEEAEPLYLRSLEIYQQTFGDNHPQVAQILNNLAGLYKSQGKFEKAEILYLRSLEIRDQILGFEHPSIANSLNNLAVLYTAQGLSDKAKPLFQRALEISRRSLGNDHPLSKSLQQKLEAVE
jgi:tetratricopeptide (TPR) repeat protein